MTPRDEAFAQLYRELRVEEQGHWYATRADLYAAAHRQARYGRVALLGLASAAGGAAAFLSGTASAALGVTAAVLAALATALAAYDALIGFTPLRKLYRDAARNLAVATGFEQAEQVIAGENGQWGQLTLNAPPLASSAGAGDQRRE